LKEKKGVVVYVRREDEDEDEVEVEVEVEVEYIINNPKIDCAALNESREVNFTPSID
jgi:hypothetical protein